MYDSSFKVNGLALPKFHSKHASIRVHHHARNTRVYYGVTSFRKRAQRHTIQLRDYSAQKKGLYSLSFIVNTQAIHYTIINETLRVYYGVTSFRKRAQRHTIQLRDYSAQKTGLHSLSFIVI